MLRWNGSDWTPVIDRIEAQTPGDRSGSAVSLSADGQTVAVGAIFSDSNGSGAGQVRVFDLTRSPEDDDDNDGVMNAADLCPGTPDADTALVNAEGCGPSQRDSDGDGVNDDIDAFPDDASETLDSDGDGLGDNRERQLGTNPQRVDSDNDGFSDSEEVAAATDPLSAADSPTSATLNIILIKAALDANPDPTP